MRRASARGVDCKPTMRSAEERFGPANGARAGCAGRLEPHGRGGRGPCARAAAGGCCEPWGASTLDEGALAESTVEVVGASRLGASREVDGGSGGLHDGIEPSPDGRLARLHGAHEGVSDRVRAVVGSAGSRRRRAPASARTQRCGGDRVVVVPAIRVAVRLAVRTGAAAVASAAEPLPYLGVELGAVPVMLEPGRRRPPAPPMRRDSNGREGAG